MADWGMEDSQGVSQVGDYPLPDSQRLELFDSVSDSEIDAIFSLRHGEMENAFANFSQANGPLSTVNNQGQLVLASTATTLSGAQGLPIVETDMDMSPTFFQQIAPPDADGSFKLENISSSDLLGGFGNHNALVPAANYVDSKGLPVAGPSSVISNYGGEIWNKNILVPQEEEVILDKWRGNYNFSVTPLMDEDKVVKRKTLFAIDQNKLYCNVSTAVKFKFEMDYGRIENLDRLMVRAYLVYEDNDAVNKPVLRCSRCIETESNITDDSKKDRLAHMLRPMEGKTDTIYFQNELSKRCYLVMPLKRPEVSEKLKFQAPGMTYVTRSFCFTCRNSCNVLDVDGKSRRAISIVFYLFEKCTGIVVGRSHSHVRVCSAPARDYGKETAAYLASGGVYSGRKRKSDTSEAGNLPSPKRVSIGANTGEVPLNQMNGSPASGQSEPRTPDSLRSVVRAPVAGRSEEDGVSSSQETVYSCDESEHKIQLRDLIGDLRWVLKQKHSNKAALRKYSDHVFNALKLIQDLCNSARCLDQELRKEGQESSAGGVRDVGQD